ncbi:MAG: Cof-type HAD-IIB family hydrolase [Acutalibacteraceae bacterium]
MKYKILALDIDGTVVTSDKRVSKRTHDILYSFQKKGGIVLLASGRPEAGMRHVAQELELDKFGGYMLSYNGGKIMQCGTNKIICQTLFPTAYISEIMDFIRDYPVGINTYLNDKIVASHNINEYTYVESKVTGMEMEIIEDFNTMAQFDINKLLMHGDPAVILELEQKLSEKYQGKLGVFKSEPYFLEIVPQGIDKAASIDKLLKTLGMEKDECIACGDGFNDISMIKYAGLGVAMANASPLVKQYANYITLTNDQDGVAFVVDKFINYPLHNAQYAMCQA